MPDDYPAPISTGQFEAWSAREFDRLVEEVVGERYARAANPLPSNIWSATPEYESYLRDTVRMTWKYGDAKQRMRLVIAHIGNMGNSKLPSHYLIWNMTPAHMCPSLVFTKDGMIDMDRTTCQAFRVNPKELRGTAVSTDTSKNGVFDCYAWRGENSGFRKNVWQFRIRQNEIWEGVLKHDPELMVDAVLVMRQLAKKNKPVALRFSESGDFPDQASVNAFIYIADRLGKLIDAGDTKYGGKKWGLPFITYAYTARRRLRYERAASISPCVIMGSGFKKKGINGQFMYVMDEDEGPEEKGRGSRYGMWPKTDWSMCFQDCRKCRRCILGLNSKVLRH